ncbi:MAG: hypothetical protein J6386_21645 [Candidatus Synoicihabitans palmerolidicus]|nr:hypothetical protein [Candidatus Synoicihabitans palmerolidicus]
MNISRLGLCALLISTIHAAPAQSPFSDKLLHHDSFWGDGKAEMTVFKARENRYGKLRETEIRHILVREDFASQEHVKADDWRAPGSYPVIKLNQVITVPTGSYRYDQGYSSFWRQDDGTLIKFASTTNDSCGLSYKQGNLDDGAWHYRAFTYWEGMSEIDSTVEPPAGALFYDELPFKLRTLDWGKVTLFEAPLLESMIDSKADQLNWPSAAFAIQRTPDGWRVTVTHARGTDRLTFDRDSPHALSHWFRWDGSVLERSQLIRLPYWQLNQPGDECYLQAGATYP